MIKLYFYLALSCLLLTGMCRADELMIQRTPKGYLIMLQTPTGKHCWGMPERLDLHYIPEKPMDVEAAAAKYKWPPAKGKQIKLCQQMKNIIWKVYTNQDQAIQPVYKVINNKNQVKNNVTDTVIDHIKSNAVCGGYINNYGISTDLTWRQVTGIKDKLGAALCKEYR